MKIEVMSGWARKELAGAGSCTERDVRTHACGVGFLHPLSG
jgi:hypothetical protein